MRTILVVDDEPGIREVMVMLLTDEGYRVLQAENGALALQLLSTETPDLVVLDIMMPLVDGFEVLRQISNMPSLEATHVILMSAAIKARPDYRVAAFIPKPFELDQLLITIRGLVGCADGANP